MPAQIIGQTHGTGGVALHRVNSTVSCARSGSDDRPGVRRQAVDPIASQDWLPRCAVGSKGRPVTRVLVALIGDGAFHDQDEGAQLALGGAIERREEVVAIFVGEEGIVKLDAGNAWQCAEHQLFQRGLGGRGDGNCLPIAPESSGQPEDVHFGNARLVLRRPSCATVAT